MPLATDSRRRRSRIEPRRRSRRGAAPLPLGVGGGPGSLEELLIGTWAQLEAGTMAPCPVCAEQRLLTGGCEEVVPIVVELRRRS